MTSETNISVISLDPSNTLTNFTIDNFNGTDYTCSIGDNGKWAGGYVDINTLLGGHDNYDRVNYARVNVAVTCYLPTYMYSADILIRIAYNCNLMYPNDAGVSTIRNTTSHTLTFTQTINTVVASVDIPINGIISNSTSTEIILYLDDIIGGAIFNFTTKLINYDTLDDMTNKIALLYSDFDDSGHYIQYSTKLKTFSYSGGTYKDTKASQIVSCIGEPSYQTVWGTITSYTNFESGMYKKYIEHFGKTFVGVVGIRYEDGIYGTKGDLISDTTNALSDDATTPSLQFSLPIQYKDFVIVYAQNPIDIKSIVLTGINPTCSVDRLQSTYATGHTVKMEFLVIKYSVADNSIITSSSSEVISDGTVATLSSTDTNIDIGKNSIIAGMVKGSYLIDGVYQFSSYLHGDIKSVQDVYTPHTPTLVFKGNGVVMSEYIGDYLVVDSDNLSIEMTRPLDDYALQFNGKVYDQYGNILSFASIAPGTSDTTLYLNNVKINANLYDTLELRIVYDINYSKSVAVKTSDFKNIFGGAYYTDRTFNFTYSTSGSIEIIQKVIFLPGWQGKVGDIINPKKIADFSYLNIEKVSNVEDNNFDASGNPPS